MKTYTVFAIANTPDDFAGIVAKLQQVELKMPVQLVTMAAGASDDAFFALGASSILGISAKDCGGLLDNAVETIVGLMCEAENPFVILPDSPSYTGLAGRLAARFGTTLIPAVESVAVRDDELIFERLVLGGKAKSREVGLGGARVITVAVDELAEGCSTPISGTRQQVAFVDVAPMLSLEASESLPPELRQLEKARRVVCVGAGLCDIEDMALIRDLADALDAEVVYTRKLTDREPSLDKHRHLGISGVTVRPDLYVGVGVSGQPQHMSGMSKAKRIVAITKDPLCPLAKAADFALIGDYRDLLPGIITGIREELGLMGA